MNDISYNSSDAFEDILDHDGHRDRIRKRILKEGVDALPPLQIIEFLLYYALPRQDVEGIARKMLDHFGDPLALFHARTEDFRRIEGLGEAGAQWMGLISDCMRKFARLSYLDSIVVENHLHLVKQARLLSKILPAPCCVQLLTDENALLTLRRPLGFTLEWAQVDLLRGAMDDISAVQAKNAYLIIITDDWRKHPNSYDLNHIQDYALLLRHACCHLQDVLFISADGYASMRRLNLLPDMTQTHSLRRFIAEDEMEDLLNRDMKIIAHPKEHMHDRPEPV